jgi:plasmid stabilization system protein ParE
MRVDVHPTADRELEEIARYINEQRTGYGERFLAAYGRALAMLLTFPRSGPRTRAGRRKRISGFRYDIIYRLHGDLIFVVAIAHHRRRAFWLHRRRRPPQIR